MTGLFCFCLHSIELGSNDIFLIIFSTFQEDKEATKRKAEDDKIEPEPVSAEKVAKLKEGQEETKEKETAEAEKA